MITKRQRMNLSEMLSENWPFNTTQWRTKTNWPSARSNSTQSARPMMYFQTKTDERFMINMEKLDLKTVFQFKMKILKLMIKVWSGVTASKEILLRFSKPSLEVPTPILISWSLSLVRHHVPKNQKEHQQILSMYAAAVFMNSTTAPWKHSHLSKINFFQMEDQ